MASATMSGRNVSAALTTWIYKGQATKQPKRAQHSTAQHVCGGPVKGIQLHITTHYNNFDRVGVDSGTGADLVAFRCGGRIS